MIADTAGTTTTDGTGAAMMTILVAATMTEGTTIGAIATVTATGMTAVMTIGDTKLVLGYS